MSLHGFVAGVGYEDKVVYDSKSQCMQLGDSATVWQAGVKPVVSGGRRGVDLPGVGRVFEGERLKGGGEMAAVSSRPGLAKLTACGEHKTYKILHPGKWERVKRR